MEKKTFSIPNISCGHCVMAIKNELSELDGIKMVEGNPEAKRI
ncbi:MAG: heavy-metal-associated domain-containing protein, partial [Desulfobacteraceae bacterium]|nr:heavy-metal-associated domain-containing protein [Desulfobacteraceae bacterium]